MPYNVDREKIIFDNIINTINFYYSIIIIYPSIIYYSATWDDIKQEYDAKYGKTQSKTNKIKVTDTIANVTTTIAIIIPVFALAILPIAGKIIKDIDTNPPSQDPNEQPTTPIPIPIPA